MYARDCHVDLFPLFGPSLTPVWRCVARPCCGVIFCLLCNILFADFPKGNKWVKLKARQVGVNVDATPPVLFACQPLERREDDNLLTAI